MRLPVTTTRWRRKITNYDFMRDVAGGAGHRVRAICVGEHAANENNGTGNFTADPTLAVADPNAVMPNDGTH